jgi:hypothetical protein
MATHVFACSCGDSEQKSRSDSSGNSKMGRRDLAKGVRPRERMVYRSRYKPQHNYSNFSAGFSFPNSLV